MQEGERIIDEFLTGVRRTFEEEVSAHSSELKRQDLEAGLAKFAGKFVMVGFQWTISAMWGVVAVQAALIAYTGNWRRAMTDGTVDRYAHIMPEVEKLWDRVAIMHRGRILDAGTLGELRAKHGEDDMEELFFKLAGEPEIT